MGGRLSFFIATVAALGMSVVLGASFLKPWAQDWNAPGESYFVVTVDHGILTIVAKPDGRSVAEMPDVARLIRTFGDSEESQRGGFAVKTAAEMAFAGLRFTRRIISLGPNRLSQRIDVRLPLWMPVVLLGAYPAYVLSAGVLRRRQRRRRGLCQGCGYDLRGSNGRCPECGMSRVAGAT